jgi:phosphatidylinositol alpha 1,6-mannosyltransferase
LWVESTTEDRRRGRLEPLKRAMLRACAGFVVPGTASLEYLEALGVDRTLVSLAPNAVDPGIFGRAVRQRTDGPCRVVAVGRLSPEKGMDVLVRAAADLPVEVVIAGAGPQEPFLRRIATENVSFLGNVERDALPQIYADSDIAVVPSRSETWGMALNEAALAGLPLVSSTVVGGSRDLIDEGVNGFRVPPDDPAALRDALRRLVDDDELRRSAGARSREIAAEFTPDRWANAVAELVELLAR